MNSHTALPDSDVSFKPLPRDGTREVSREDLVDELSAWLHDCQFEATTLSTTLAVFAMDSVYRPVLGFWARMDVSAVVDAMVRYAPQCRQIIDGRRSSGVDEFMREVQEVLDMYRSTKRARNAC
jgi:hypothetical protein